MIQFVAQRTIHAPVEQVFAVAAHVQGMARALPHLTSFEFLGEQQTGVGTRFRETRLMKGREHITELEVTEYQPSEYVRMVSLAGGTVWDTVFAFKAAGADSTELTITMDATAQNMLARCMNHVIKQMIRTAMEDDISRIKAYCETQADV